MSNVKAQDFRFNLIFDYAFGVKAEGLNGGLVMIWDTVSVVSIKSFVGHILMPRSRMAESLDMREGMEIHWFLWWACESEQNEELGHLKISA
jgi:hypothetical protein